MKKARAYKTKIESFKKWKSRGWIEVNGLDGKKRYAEPSPLEPINKTYYDIDQLKLKYQEYVDKCKDFQNIENHYELFQKAYECTMNSWHEVDSLGVTIHYDTPGIYSETYLGKTPGDAKFKFMRYNDVEYKDIKIRRNPDEDLYVIKNRQKLIDLFDKKTLGMMLNATGCRLDSASLGHRNRYQVKYSEEWEDLIEKDFARKEFHDGLNFYSLTDYGLNFIKSIIPTKNRHIHYQYSLSELFKENHFLAIHISSNIVKFINQ